MSNIFILFSWKLNAQKSFVTWILQMVLFYNWDFKCSKIVLMVHRCPDPFSPPKSELFVYTRKIIKSWVFKAIFQTLLAIHYIITAVTSSWAQSSILILYVSFHRYCISFLCYFLFILYSQICQIHFFSFSEIVFFLSCFLFTKTEKDVFSIIFLKLTQVVREWVPGLLLLR